MQENACELLSESIMNFASHSIAFFDDFRARQPAYDPAQAGPSAPQARTWKSEKAVWILAGARIRQTESTGLGSHLSWPGFHIRMNVHIQVNENPGEKLQFLSKKVEFISLGFP